MSVARASLPRLSLLLILSLVAAGCGGGAQSPGPSSAPVSSPAQAGQTVEAAIVDTAFQPAELTIAAGTTVVWTNTGQLPHTVTASDGSFKSEGNLSSGDVYEHTFDTAGTFAYICAIHASMKGTVVVTP
jgi:plastocyanin